MPEILIAILFLSVAVAWWAFYRAHRLHHRIEAIHPGFNCIMREIQKHRRRRYAGHLQLREIWMPLPIMKGAGIMLSGYKTYITAAVAVITAVATYLTGEASLADTLQLAFGAILAAFIRSGVKADTGQ